MDAIDLLEADHRDIEMMFARYRDVDKKPSIVMTKSAIAKQICQALTVHSMIESKAFYPQALALLGPHDTLVFGLLEEHVEATDLIEQIKAAEDNELDTLVEDLCQLITHHVQEEEDMLFPKLRDAHMETSSLGRKLEALKKQIFTAGI